MAPGYAEGLRPGKRDEGSEPVGSFEGGGWGGDFGFGIADFGFGVGREALVG